MTLYIVSTPIGNLEDMTYRAARILKDVELILCEDTRRTGKLLAAYDIKKRMLPYNDFNERKITHQIIPLLKEGKEIALVSDCGTPLLSDPGFFLVREAISQGIAVVPVPGASALLAALVASGCAPDKFTFLGFLPKKEKGRKDVFAMIKGQSEMTFVFYESPYRINDAIADLAEVLPERNICISRELTKKFEEFYRGKSVRAYEMINGKKLKGEFVVVVDKLCIGNISDSPQGTISIDESMRRHKEKYKKN